MLLGVINKKTLCFFEKKENRQVKKQIKHWRDECVFLVFFTVGHKSYQQVSKFWDYEIARSTQFGFLLIDRAYECFWLQLRK